MKLVAVGGVPTTELDDEEDVLIDRAPPEAAAAAMMLAGVTQIFAERLP